MVDQHGELDDVAEIRRLRYLDMKHREISENAEAEVRSLKLKARTMSKDLASLTHRIRHSMAEDNVPQTDDAWGRVDDIIVALLRL